MSRTHLSIVIPAFNEAERIPKTIEEILDFLSDYQHTAKVIVINDGSSDATKDVVAKYQNKYPEQLQLISLEANSGKGAAIQAGVVAADSDYILFADADGSTPILELTRLEAAMGQGADIAIASRAKPSKETHLDTLWYRKLLGRSFNFVVNLMILPGFYDTQCGFKLFKADVAKKLFAELQTTGFGFDLEILYRARKQKLQIKEVAVNWHHVDGSKVSLLSDALRMFFDIVKIRRSCA